MALSPSSRGSPLVKYSVAFGPLGEYFVFDNSILYCSGVPGPGRRRYATLSLAAVACHSSEIYLHST